jgi:hypothetical protein
MKVRRIEETQDEDMINRKKKLGFTIEMGLKNFNM